MLSTPVSHRLITQLNVAVFEQQADGRFTCYGTPPQWLTALWPELRTTTAHLDLAEQFLYLDHFLTFDARPFWEDHVDSSTEGSSADASVTSNPWTEELPSGKQVLLHAQALHLDGRPLLLLKFADTPPDRLRSILQESRTQGLELHRLIREINKRELLLHCIVHDLSTPLAGIRASLELMHEDDLVADAGEPLFNVARKQVEKMRNQIQQILHTFSNDIRPILPSLVSAEQAPNLAAVVSDVAGLMQPAASGNGVSLVFEEPADDTPYPVIAEATRLERVLFNLLDNAIRHTPEGTSVTVRMHQHDHTVTLDVLDEGPGVADEQVADLFAAYTQGSADAGAAGLGLYFCRITMEDWGGSIGYTPRPNGGSCFRLTFQQPAPFFP